MNYERRANHLKAMGHPTRLQILDMLRRGQTCVCHIEAALGRRQAYVSQHLMVLRDAGLVECRKDGLQVYYRLASAEIDALVSHVCGPLDETAWQPVEACRCPSCAALQSPAPLSGDISCCT